MTSIADAGGGAVAIGTTGGLVIIDSEGNRTKFTRLSGLPSNEVAGLERDGSGLLVRFPAAAAVRYESGQITPVTTTASIRHDIVVNWRGREWAATGDLVSCGSDHLSAPKGTAIITGLASDGNSLWLTGLGSGVFEWKDSRWRQIAPDIKEQTALAVIDGEVWIGTRRNGAVRITANGSKQWIDDSGEISSNGVVSFFEFKGLLYACTLEDGLAKWDDKRWSTVLGPSTTSPRQGVVFHGLLYLRHANGTIDTFDGKQWRSGYEQNLRRPECSAMTASEDRIVFGQWGGWSTFDGVKWVHRFDVSTLTGNQVTALAMSKDTLWVGTQRCGLIQVGPGNELRTYSFAEGLADDWVTTVVVRGSTLIAGTFGGGAYQIKGRDLEKLDVGSPAVRGMNSGHSLWAATAAGVTSIGPAPALPTGFNLAEPQAVYEREGELWVGCRTGVYRMKI